MNDCFGTVDTRVNNLKVGLIRVTITLRHSFPKGYILNVIEKYRNTRKMQFQSRKKEPEVEHD